MISDDKLRGRLVKDKNSQLIAIGACSGVLTPYVFRNDINNGAQLIALNISFAQFAKTPEYKNFADRYMIFMAHAYQRPLAAGVQDGQALFVSPYNNEGLKQQDIVTSDIPYNMNKTPYTKLGDFWILTIIGLLTLTSIGLPRLLNNKKTSQKKNKSKP